MRHVFSSHAEVAHVWANNRHEVGHGSGKNVYFDGDTIYSYGRHFPIASFVTARDGSDVVLFTTRSYSVSTAKHTGIVRRAIRPGTPIYYTADPSSRDWRMMMRQSLEQAASLKAQAERRRSAWRKDYDLEAMERHIAAARFFAYEGRLRLPPDDEKALASAERYRREEEKRFRAARLAAEAAERERKERAEAYWDRLKPYWRSHQQFPPAILDEARAEGLHPSSAHGLSIAMRLTPDGSEIETSWGARFPVDHGIHAFRILKGLWERGATWERDGTGPRLGHYTIDEVTPDGVQAGCHWVSRAEIELMADALNVADVQPTPVVAVAAQ
jgi:hypothetical protein